jgi:hypothetical protein
MNQDKNILVVWIINHNLNYIKRFGGDQKEIEDLKSCWLLLFTFLNLLKSKYKLR